MFSFAPASALVLLCAAFVCSAQTTPTLPLLEVDTDLSHAPVTGKSIPVRAGEDLQAAIDKARPGDEIVLEAGQTWTGTFVLPDKGKSTTWIRIRSSAMAALPAPGHRVSPADAIHMPKIVAPGSAQAFKITARANHYRLIGLELTEQPKQSINYGLIMQGDPNDPNVADLPSYITVDRCYLHGRVLGHIKFGWQLNGSHLALIDSYVSEFHGMGQDTQAITGYMGPGPLKIVNNFLEGAGENILFGGAYDAIPNTTTADVTFTGNYLYKPQKWRTDSIVPAPAGLSATAVSGGKLDVGTYYYAVIARGTAGTLEAFPGECQSARSTEIPVTLNGNQHAVRLQWTESPYGDQEDSRLADNYVVLRSQDEPGTPSRRWVYYTATAPNGNRTIAFVDNGTEAKTGFGEWARYWSVKNLFEIKNGVRWLIEGNVMDGNWVSAQNGFSILLTPRNEVPFMPGNRITDITFRNNIIRNVAGGINISAEDDTSPASEAPRQIPTARVLFYNNLFENVNWGYNGNGVFFQAGVGIRPGQPGVQDVILDHNTIFQTGNIADLNNCCGLPIKNLTVTNNVFAEGPYGWYVNGLGPSLGAITKVVDHLIFKNNLWAGNPEPYRIPTNWYADSLEHVGFINYHGGSGGDYHLSTKSHYKGKATDGSDPGADIGVLDQVARKATGGE